MAGTPLVITSPTGSGKSTQVPRWCGQRGRTLVIEPRRVACRALAERVAHLEKARLGHRVGYRVRDDTCARDDTLIQFVTPGVALRMVQGGQLDDFAAIVIDEFHERSLDLDLLLALGRARAADRLVVMSATLDGDRLAEWLGGEHLTADGRTFPVDIRYLPGGQTLPSDDRLVSRVCKAVRSAKDPGDILIFLPGKAEIRAVVSGLQGGGDTVLELHGGLSLRDQRAAFESSSKRKIVVATNVAETSLTIPGIGVVIDAGLVRRTRYHGGRGFLTLLPVASDSADQRAGRAGRMAAGVCYRLWSQAANLRPSTPPEIHRESLVPLVLGAAACGETVEGLEFADPPKPHAVESAREELEALGAIDASGVTEAGRALFGLPLDAALGRLLVEARGDPAQDDVVDLVAALAVSRPLFAFGSRPDPDDDLRVSGCDVTALISAVRFGDPVQHRLNSGTLAEARRIRDRLRRVMGDGPDPGGVDRHALALLLLRADPRLAHVARRRKRATAWSNGGTELKLGRDCGLTPIMDTPAGAKIDAVLVLDSRAIGRDARRTELVITAAMPVPIRWLVEAGVGRTRVARAKVVRGKVIAEVERVHAKRVLATEEVKPTGQAARDAVAQCFVEGRLWKQARAEAEDRLAVQALAARLAGDNRASAPELLDWVTERLAELGMESGEDLALLGPDDLLPEPLPAHTRDEIDRNYPRVLDLPDITYRVIYHLGRKLAVLEKTGGRRKDAPPRHWIPRLGGLRVEAHHGNVIYRVR